MSITLECSSIAPANNENDASTSASLHFIPAKIKTESTERLNIANFFNNYTVEVDNGNRAHIFLLALKYFLIPNLYLT